MAATLGSLHAVYEADTCQLWMEIDGGRQGAGNLGSMHTQCEWDEQREREREEKIVRGGKRSSATCASGGCSGF